MNSYPVRSISRLSVVFLDDTNAPADPGSVALTVTLPDGTQVDESGSIVKDGIGRYHFDYIVALVGVYSYKWQGDSGLVAANASQQFQGIR